MCPVSLTPPPPSDRPGSPDPAALCVTVGLDGRLIEADARLCHLLDRTAVQTGRLQDLLSEHTAQMLQGFISGTAPTDIFQDWLPIPGRPALPVMIAVARQTDRVELRLAVLADVSAAYLAEMNAQAEILSSMLATAPEAFWCIEYQEPIDLCLTEDSVIDQFFRNASCWRACNPAMPQLYQLPEGIDFHDQPVSRYFPETKVNRAMVRDLVRAGYALDGAVAIDYRHDGSEMLVVNSFHARVENGHLLRLWGTVRDISTEREREDNLAAQASDMEGILTALPDPVIVVGQEGGVLAVNPAAERMLGVGLHLGQSLEAAGFPAETVRRLREMAVLGNDDVVPLQLARHEPLGEIWLLRAALAEGAEGRLVISAFRQPAQVKALRRKGGTK